MAEDGIDVLFDVRNALHIGNYQTCVAEAEKVQVSHTRALRLGKKRGRRKWKEKNEKDREADGECREDERRKRRADCGSTVYNCAPVVSCGARRSTEASGEEEEEERG